MREKNVTPHHSEWVIRDPYPLLQAGWRLPCPWWQRLITAPTYMETAFCVLDKTMFRANA